MDDNNNSKCNIKEISIPLGRQLSCCDAALRFLGFVQALLIQLEQRIFQLPDITLRDRLLVFVKQNLEESVRFFKELASCKCNPNCCVESSRALAFVSNRLINDTFNSNSCRIHGNRSISSSCTKSI